MFLKGWAPSHYVIQYEKFKTAWQRLGEFSKEEKHHLLKSGTNTFFKIAIDMKIKLCQFSCFDADLGFLCVQS